MAQPRRPLPWAPLYLAVALAGRAGAQFALLVVFTRLQGADGAADFVLATAILAPLVPIAELAFRQLYVLAPREGALGPYVGVRTVAFAILAAVVLGVIGPTAGMPEELLGALLAVRAVDGLADLCHARIQRHDGVVTMASLVFGNAVATIAAMTIVALKTHDAMAALWSSLGVSAAFLALAVFLAVRTRPRNDAAEVRPRPKDLVRNGFPVGVGVALTGLTAAVPQYVMASTSSRATMTAFAFMMYVVVSMDLLVSGVSQARLNPIRETLAHSGPAAMRSMVRRDSGWLAAATLVLGGFGFVVLPIVVRVAADASIQWGVMTFALALLVVGLLPLPPMVTFALNAMGRNDAPLVASAVGAAGVVMVSLTTVAHWGLTGGLLAVAAGFVLRTAVLEHRLGVAVRVVPRGGRIGV